MRRCLHLLAISTEQRELEGGPYHSQPAAQGEAGKERAKNDKTRGKQPPAAMGRMHAGEDAQRSAGEAAAGWEAAAPGMLNSGLGLQRGGRCRGCFAAASLHHRTSEPTVGWGAAAATSGPCCSWARSTEGYCRGLDASPGQRALSRAL